MNFALKMMKLVLKMDEVCILNIDDLDANRLPNCIVTPHNAGGTHAASDKAMIFVMKIAVEMPSVFQFFRLKTPKEGRIARGKR